MTIIQVDKLTMTYRSGKGIFDISFNVKEGECFGYLGPNGAGKTTTIRQLMGFTNADQGKCLIKGVDTRDRSEEIQKHIGYLPDELSFFSGMTGKKFLDFMYDLRKLHDRSLMEKLIADFELDIKTKIDNMSKGMKRKLGIITAFMHDPDIYILDEPTSGLDPLMQKKLINLILDEKERNKTILMSSHRFDEIESTADTAGIIKEGRLVTVKDIESLRASRQKIFIVTVSREEDIEKFKDSKLRIGYIKGRQVEVIISDDINEFTNLLARCKIESLDTRRQNLEQVFMKYYGREGETDE